MSRPRLLSTVLPPLGLPNLRLRQIREMAAALDLPTKARKDSQGICFLGKLRFDDFLRHYLGEQPGDVRWVENGLLVGESVVPKAGRGALRASALGTAPRAALVEVVPRRRWWLLLPSVTDLDG